MDGLPREVITHDQLQVERRTGNVRRSQTDVLPLCHATNSNNKDYLLTSYLLTYCFARADVEDRELRADVESDGGILAGRVCRLDGGRH